MSPQNSGCALFQLRYLCGGLGGSPLRAGFNAPSSTTASQPIPNAKSANQGRSTHPLMLPRIAKQFP